MLVLSIDIGIRNLSFCLLEYTNKDINTFKIIKWDNVDLTKDAEKTCVEIDKNGLCGKPAKYSKNNLCYCLKHSKKLTQYIQPNKELSTAFINKQKIQSLMEIADKYKMQYETPLKKANLIHCITEFSSKNCLEEVKKTNAKKLDLVTIGKNIQYHFDDILENYTQYIDKIIIENQIGPLANKMKTIQGQIAQYFIMKNNNIDIDFVNASNKLKDFIQSSEKTDYKQRKKLSIETTGNLVTNDHRFTDWANMFQKHSKKDDLADCFLQGLWYLNHKI
uniref:Mitochondrial resolvase Ydc2 catalytic domain-containing protein n=1 Tax=viral metagenome TaxID=1070528 RepID=A0A6C0IS54_9ZZZZ